MDRPGRGDDRVEVLHHDIAGLGRLAHKVHDHVVVGEFKIGIDLHAALVGVAGHRVPDAAGGQLRQSHRELAGVQHLGVDELVDDALVGARLAAERALVGVGKGEEGGLAGAVRRGAREIEAGGVFAVLARKADALRAHGNIQAVLIAELEDRAVALDGAGAAQVEYAGLAALQEEVGAKVVPHVDALVDGDNLMHGHDAHDDHAVDMGIGGLDGIGLVQIGDEELFSQFLGRIAFHIVRAGRIADIHSFPPKQKYCSL